MFGGSAYLFLIIKYFSFAFVLFIPFATQLFSTLVMSSNLRNQAPLFMELRLSQATFLKHDAVSKQMWWNLRQGCQVGLVMTSKKDQINLPIN